MAGEPTQRFDYVIVGAGSAGCVLANRLSADPAVKVCLLEAGGRDTSVLITMPAGAAQIFKEKGPHNWGFWTAPQEHMNGRRLWWPRGRGWGGSSSINGNIYIRGHARDYDQWRQLGLAGWSYRDVLPYFRRAETCEAGADPWRGDSGPLHVSVPRSGHPLFKAFIDAGRQAGHPYTRDFNGRQQEGVGPYQVTIKDGERWSAARAYLHPALSRPNLTVISNARATRLVFEGRRAVGVAFSAGPGKPVREVRAASEVLLCAGAVQSPQILMLSGVGDPDHLRAHGLPVVAPLREVGRNLQDHLDVVVSQECSQPITLHTMRKGLRQLFVGMDYVFRRQGIGRFNWLESGAFLRTRPELDRPDVQIHFVGAILIEHGKVDLQKDGYSSHVCQLRPQSRGTVTLASADPFADPAIDPNYLAEELDRRTMVEGVKRAREIMAQQAFAPYRAGEITPGDSVRADAEIEEWVRRTGETIYHPVGTVRMGADAEAPLDAELRVKGLEGLRVVDASAMPLLVGGNTNAPTIMLAEKAADMILGRPALAPEDAPIAEDAAAAA